MTYAGTKTILDADSHVMERVGFLDNFIAPAMKDRLKVDFFDMIAPLLGDAAEKAELRKRDAAAAAEAATRIMTDKAWFALGAFDPAERSTALDLLGFDGQLVFATFTWGTFVGPDLERQTAGASAHNRAMADFCAGDDRMYAVGYVPLTDTKAAAELAIEAVELGCKAILIPHVAAGDKAPTHPDLDPFWDVLNSANVPFVLHVGGSGHPAGFIDQAYHNNGRPVAGHLGERGEGARAKDVIAVDHAVQIFLGALIFDGLFDKFPNLRGGVIEQGAGWVVSWMRRLDHLVGTFSKFEEPLRDLKASPSEYIRNHLKFTPYAREPVGWMIENGGPELFMFSTDYPHPEGGTQPIHHFDESLKGTDPASVDRFYAGNMRELLTGSVNGASEEPTTPR